MDWEKFTACVPVGTHVQCLDTNSDNVVWEGVLLENWPHQSEETIADQVTLEGAQSLRENYDNNPALRLQDFSSPDVDMVLPSWPRMRYLINGKWLTFDEVMRLP